jgi:hypothetical protein
MRTTVDGGMQNVIDNLCKLGAAEFEEVLTSILSKESPLYKEVSLLVRKTNESNLNNKRFSRKATF